MKFYGASGLIMCANFTSWFVTWLITLKTKNDLTVNNLLTEEKISLNNAVFVGEITLIDKGDY